MIKKSEAENSNADQTDEEQDCKIFSDHNFLVLIRNELPTTDTEDIAIAKPAKIGFKSQPKIG